MVLYSYPSLVLLGSALFLGAKVRMPTIVAMVIAYLGIVIAYAGETKTGGAGGGKELWGVALIFASAVTYAIFVVAGGKLLREIGAARFTANVVGISCLFMLMHFSFSHGFGAFTEQPAGVHGHCIVLAIFGTLVPSFLLGWGLKRTSRPDDGKLLRAGPLQSPSQ